jgi:hypothetical protein
MASKVGASPGAIRLHDLVIQGSLWLAGKTKLVLPITAILAPAGGTLCVTLGQNFKDKGDWAFVIFGIALIAFGGLLQILKQLASAAVVKAGDLQAARFRIATKDVIQPIAADIAEMVTMSENDRKLQLKAVAAQVSGALIVLLKDVSRLRAIVYTKNEKGGLECISYNGRGDEPAPFEKGNPRGDAALRLVERGGLPKFVKDIHNKTDPDMSDFHGTGDSYRTFVTGGIGTKNGQRYGMVSIDAPEPNCLVDTDRYVVGMLADLMAIAFAVANASGNPSKARA